MTREEPTAGVTARPRGYVLRGRLWPGGGEPAIDDAVVVVDAEGIVAAYGPAHLVDLPDGVPVVAGGWVGPGVVDAHVHLAFGSAAAMAAGGVVAVRDLGSPVDDARDRRAPDAVPVVAVSGPLLTAPGGYPSRSWGARGFARFLGSPGEARRAVGTLVDAGVDVVKVALEPADGLPVPPAEVVRAVVDAAHDAGLAVTCHALTVEMVSRALDAGADELAHLPVEHLPTHLVARLALEEVPVVSTLHTLVGQGGPQANAVRANARALVGAGVPLVYGTDLGNTGTSTGVDVEELALLAEAGLGDEGAMRAATEGSAGVHGLRGRCEPAVVVGRRAHMVVLPADPLSEPKSWTSPLAVVSGREVVRP
ncbi:MAG: amidohydrolase family protein [Streptosporangiales bacterium]|nr:amidohydrolase family protein [Streptosporangiales bacterium]